MGLLYVNYKTYNAARVYSSCLHAPGMVSVMYLWKYTSIYESSACAVLCLLYRGFQVARNQNYKYLHMLPNIIYS